MHSSEPEVFFFERFLTTNLTSVIDEVSFRLSISSRGVLQFVRLQGMVWFCLSC